ncbi:MAG: hypothetical protein LBS99_06745, partial [Clostridiales bacterium]|nr:hypothetical protein [Clostridiales bacterium]
MTPRNYLRLIKNESDCRIIDMQYKLGMLVFFLSLVLTVLFNVFKSTDFIAALVLGSLAAIGILSYMLMSVLLKKR